MSLNYIIKIYSKAATAPIAAVTPPPAAVAVSTPVIPQEVNVENIEPAATFPMAACVAAAKLPAATPAVPKPNNVAPRPPAATKLPPIINMLAIFLKIKVIYSIYIN